MSDPIAEHPIRIVYCGTPAFAVPALESLASDPRFEVALVVTQPDRPAGRGRRSQPSPVKLAAEAMGIPTHQPERLRSVTERRPIVDATPDVVVVAAYGVIFGPRMLAIPRHGCLNLHASLLPAYRGASPISAAIAAGEPVTGVTLMRMDVGLDTGSMIATAEVPIAPRDTTISLTERLAVAGARLAVGSIPGWVAGRLSATPQPGGATLTRPMVKGDGWLDFARPAVELERQVRAMWPWPRAWTTAGPEDDAVTIQIHAASVAPDSGSDGSTDGVATGAVALVDGSVLVRTGAGRLRLDTVQEPGGRPVPAASLVRSGRLRDGGALGRSGRPEVTALVVGVPD